MSSSLVSAQRAELSMFVRVLFRLSLWLHCLANILRKGEFGLLQSHPCLLHIMTNFWVSH